MHSRAARHRLTRCRAMTAFFFILLCYATTALPQSTNSRDNPSVMIIPFDPNMYFSDADEQLAKYNQKSVKEIRTLFRYGLNISVNAKILTYYETRPLLTDTARSAVEDLYAIYKGISYYKDKSMLPSEPEAKTSQEEKKKLLTLKKKDEESEAQTASALREPLEKHDYINVRLHDGRMLPYLNNKYGTELFVFINQFDLVTNYEHCLDRATNTFERDIKVHFSIFDHTGRQLAGDVAIVHFPSNTNDVTTIMRDNFPVIAHYLAGKLFKGTLTERESVKKYARQESEELIDLEEDK